ncbi:dinitrogenase iron-molybdenum cofactor biosynthesis protein [Oceanobacter mangrovi]|uniref:dinitrogenase iron-molybdenum cofactor biosynthesis protein n=1 Tax=Oceanobacter mangrovi TaxID=2862510 RepID=UPI001C8D8C70|nr:dinitrogenase iron-molybdenum cofactor biosynthesis protein [Oceanobacter mangrovi]
MEAALSPTPAAQPVPSITREAALRIAMAARALPEEISVGQLLEILARRIDGELNETSLTTITVTDLKTGFGSADGEEDGEDISMGLPAIKEAVRILWGEVNDDDLPKPRPELADIPGSIRVAVASNQAEQINGHFGSCVRFLVYQLAPESCELVDIRSALEADLSDDRNAFRANLIKDCQVMYVQSIGGPAAAKVVRTGIYPIKVKEACEAREELARLQSVMGTNPPPWLAKILGVETGVSARFGQLVEED